MKNRQKGFTLIEIVIAFTILAMGTVLVVNVVTQSSIRVNKVNEYLAAMNTLESAVAILRHEISRQKIKEKYQGAQSDGFQWVAKVLNEVNPGSEGNREYINLYRIHIQVFHDNARPRLELTTIFADR
jgi:prepilin-type N-terminal cleavage/methylation domain-containing protein